MNTNEPYGKLPRTFYVRSNVVEIAMDLVGKYLFTFNEGQLTGGRITETEAYSGDGDRACHAFRGKTSRNAVMFGEGGHAYVYLCYGMHHLFNVVTNREGCADAVLVRGLEPVAGVQVMSERRGRKPKSKLTAGPATLSQALGIHTGLSGASLESDFLWIASGPEKPFELVTDRRVGVDYAGEDALRPWRFFMKGSPWVSRGIQKPLSLPPVPVRK
ncbi:MAG: DNA-3-methyladenine glycosylase [Cyclobacteriaceae bacterium]|nr:DNA-3-methyladenine glycosylase [Cyclobacteriaceae bacterium]